MHGTVWNQGKSKVIDNFPFGSMSVGMVKNKYVHHAIEIQKKHFRRETNLRTVAYFFGSIMFPFIFILFFLLLFY